MHLNLTLPPCPLSMQYRDIMYCKCRWMNAIGRKLTASHSWDISLDTCNRRKKRLVEGNAKCSPLKKWPGKGLSGGYLSVWCPLPYFCLGVAEQFFMFCFWSDTLCKTPTDTVYALQYNPIPPLPVTHYLQYIHTVYLYLFTQGRRGMLNQRAKKGRGATGEESTDPKAGSKIPTLLNIRKKLAIASL